MKKNILVVGLVVLFSGFIVSCSSKKQEEKNPVSAPAEQASLYQCPMQCEGDKTYDKPGKCPVCGMDLQPVEKKTAVPENKESSIKSDSV